MRFIAGHADRCDGGLRWGVEPICRVLSEHGCPIAPSSYYEAKDRKPSARQARDEQLEAEILRVRKDNFAAYGAGKYGWHSIARASRWPAAPWSG